MVEYWCNDILPSHEQPKHRRQNAQTMDLQKMKANPLANCRNSKLRLITDIQCICTPYKQKRTHKHPAVGGHHIASEMLSRCLAPHNTNTTSSPHEEQERAIRGATPSKPSAKRVKIYYHTVPACPLPFLTYRAILTSVYWGCKSQK